MHDQEEVIAAVSTRAPSRSCLLAEPELSEMRCVGVLSGAHPALGLL